MHISAPAVIDGQGWLVGFKARIFSITGTDMHVAAAVRREDHGVVLKRIAWIVQIEYTSLVTAQLRQIDIVGRLHGWVAVAAKPTGTAALQVNQ